MPLVPQMPLRALSLVRGPLSPLTILSPPCFPLSLNRVHLLCVLPRPWLAMTGAQPSLLVP